MNPPVIASTANGRKQSRDHSTGSNEPSATLASFSQRNRILELFMNSFPAPEAKKLT
jgi:hypothetical protein